MAANQRPAPRSRNFGRIDPFCWPAIGSLLVVAVILAFGDAAEFAIIPVIFAILIAVLDSWTNRPKPGDEDRRVRTTGSNRRIADTPPPPSRVQRRPAADRMPPRANPRTAAPRENPAANRQNAAFQARRQAAQPGATRRVPPRAYPTDPPPRRDRNY